MVGLCGAQGSGKSTLAEKVVEHLSSKGLRAATFSLDDLYLPLAERERLAKEVHPLFRIRGVPGTHDVEFGCVTFEQLGVAGQMALPRLDKARYY